MQKPQLPDADTLAFSLLKIKEDATSNLLRYYVDLSDILQELEFLMQGYTFDAEDGEFKKIPGKENLCLFNEEGLGRIMFVIRSNVNKNTLLSNYTWPLIKLRMKRILLDFKDVVTLNQRRFKIKTYDISSIIASVETILLSVYTRSMDGGERGLQRSAVRGSYSLEQEQGMQQLQQLPPQKV